MTETSGKKEWSNPELIALVRSRPEEAVLYACKGDGYGPAVNAQHDACQNIVSVCALGCDAVTAS